METIAKPKSKWKATLIRGGKNLPIYWNISRGDGTTRASINVYQGDKETLKEAQTNAKKIVKALNAYEI